MLWNLIYDTLVVKSIRITEINKYPKFIPCSLKVIMHLRTMNIVKSRYSFEFHDNVVITYKISAVGLLKFHTVIHNGQFLFTIKRNAPTLKFHL